MIPGVSFQPATGNMSPVDQQRARAAGGGVQEAIKILSLRLPKVVGAQALAPSLLLTSQGSGGNPRVDSVVNQIMQRMFPSPSNANTPAAPVLPSGSSDYRSGTMPTDIRPGHYGGPVRQPPSIDVTPVTPRPAVPRFSPGERPPQENPLLETPLPTSPEPPQRALPSNDIIDWPTRYDI